VDSAINNSYCSDIPAAKTLNAINNFQLDKGIRIIRNAVNIGGNAKILR